ncbi:hypothetical protein pEaSNUABM8_00099 [Erwinia phage pEa_SNUABM_8]|nr:hypothetical protein pEaSNUABM8_00099 [Erwinia phage pEa_SNUABM_8]QVW54851.1 hypothetical protein pEaSNUABM4_00098 [Erwinia phage pEa_SNUABM_4]
MVKLFVIEMNQWRDVLLRFELPDNDATTAFLERFQQVKSGISGGRRFHVYYNVRRALVPALEAAQLPKVLKFLEKYEKDPLAIGIMKEDKELVGKPAAAD